jgi:L-fuculose-phosphate aldolase
MHLAIYQAQPDARAVVHAHPPYATATGVANIPVPMDMLAEGLGYMGEVPLLDFQVPGTPELARQVASAAEGHRVIMMKNHGATAWAETLEQAWMLMEVLEACCKVTYLTRTLGRMDPLPAEKIPQLPRARPVRKK